MKTAISIPDDIFEEVEEFAKKHHYSRSEVFLLAVKDLLERVKSRQLLDTLNELYADIETPEDKSLRKKALKHYSKSVLKERY
jgi:metal-responsive CopG/Arc/MetJ family transcriptional regulator